MDSTAVVRKRTAWQRWRQGTVDIVLALLAAWLLRHFEPNFLVLGLFPFGVLRLVQGVELSLGLARGGWTDIPMTPPVIGCWAAAAVYLQRLMVAPSLRLGAQAGAWVLLGILLYALGRWLQQRHYARRQT